VQAKKDEMVRAKADREASKKAAMEASKTNPLEKAMMALVKRAEALEEGGLFFDARARPHSVLCTFSRAPGRYISS
jgi:hypothetical protein